MTSFIKYEHLRLKAIAAVVLYKSFFWGGFYPASLFGQGPTFRECLCVSSSGSQRDPEDDVRG